MSKRAVVVIDVAGERPAVAAFAEQAHDSVAGNSRAGRYIARHSHFYHRDGSDGTLLPASGRCLVMTCPRRCGEARAAANAAAPGSPEHVDLDVPRPGKPEAQAAAEELFERSAHSWHDLPESVLIAVSPGQRVVEVVTGAAYECVK